MNLPAAALATPLIAAEKLTIAYGGTPFSILSTWLSARAKSSH
ncbi:MAG TPA: hypothetical protein VEU95_11165 [Micropepsaceae bacterium]|nr:hypothetical protein [Micropepsaceae bacterium]